MPEDVGKRIHGNLPLGQVHKGGMPDAVFLIDEDGDTPVHRPEQVGHRIAGVAQQHGRQQSGLRRDPLKGETATQGDVQRGQRAVGRIHGAEDIDIVRHAEFRPRIGEAHLQGLRRAQPLGRLDKRDEFPEDARDVAAVDLIDDEDAVLPPHRGRGGRLGGKVGPDDGGKIVQVDVLELIHGTERHLDAVIELQDVLPDILDQPVHLAQALVGRVLVMPFVLAGHDAHGVRHGFAVAGHDDVPHPHLLDEGLQNALAASRKLSLFRDVLAVGVPAYAYMAVGQTFRPDGIVAGPRKGDFPDDRRRIHGKAGEHGQILAQGFREGLRFRLLAEALENAVLHPVGELSFRFGSVVLDDGAYALDEVLVTVGLMEGRELDEALLPVGRKTFAHCGGILSLQLFQRALLDDGHGIQMRMPGLPRAGWAVEDAIFLHVSCPCRRGLKNSGLRLTNTNFTYYFNKQHRLAMHASLALGSVVASCPCILPW